MAQSFATLNDIADSMSYLIGMQPRCPPGSNSILQLKLSAVYESRMM
ncbi:hypothetical protein [Ktedonobacter robiniae]|nr:hypothetical protein [Ktedonobacter robiniae]